MKLSCFLIRLKIDSLFRFLIRLVSNILIPWVYTLPGRNGKAILNQNVNKQRKLIVTLTSFPARINRAWLVIETMLRQSHKPDKIVLWLSKNQFKSFKHLPVKLLKLRHRGLDIRLVEGDLRSHKKYYYALKEFPEDYLIIIDDDIFYRTDLIEDLYNYSLKYPEAIISQYGFQMEWENEVLKPYSLWERKIDHKMPSSDIFFGSGGGTLLPPHCLSSMATEKSLFMSFTPFADDIWLNAMCRLERTKVVTTSRSSILLPVLHFKNSKLFKMNTALNDKQINDLRTYFKNNYNLDPYNEFNCDIYKTLQY